jgi:GNAT superfamily N-acetyltransferase
VNFVTSIALPCNLESDQEWETMSTTQLATEIVRLSEQQTVIVRPIEPEDVVALLAMDARISAESRFLRYCGSAHLSLEEARDICGTGSDSMALVATPAEYPQQIIAVAFYITCEDTAPDEAEIAIVVEDAWQGMGLGTWLLTHLGMVAVQQGIHTFSAYVHAQNYLILHFIEHTHLPVTRSVSAGICEIRITLPEPQVMSALVQRYQRGAQVPE